MSSSIIQIPLSTNDSVEAAHPGKGKTRLVPAVRTPMGIMPCIWRSHVTIQADVNGDGKTIPACECILLAGRSPAVPMRAEVDLKAWEHLEMITVEW